MAKKTSKDQEQVSQSADVDPSAEMSKVLYFYRQDGAYAFCEIEIPKDILGKYGEIKSKIEPDILAILISQLTRKVKDLFGV